MEKKLEEGQVVLCTVEKMIGTTIFVKLDDYGVTGTIVTSEIAPGRIRNIRDYVDIGRRIACKILSIEGENIELSLRRVNAKEKKDAFEKHEKERNAVAILSLLAGKEKAEETARKIKEKYALINFLENAKENALLLDEFFSKEEKEKLLELIKEKIKKKIAIAKARISLRSDAANGIEMIKNALHFDNIKIKISYIGAPYYSVSVEASDYKEANKLLQETTGEIIKRMKEKGGKAEVVK